MRRMALKLFRSTGYSSILLAGETRLALHPVWMILAISLWVGLVCNVALWRQLAGSSLATGMKPALALALLVTGASVTVISFCGWRKTVKPVATLVLLVAALSAVSIWSDGKLVDGSLLGHGMTRLLLPSWAGLFRWQFFGLLAALALVPLIWMWHTPLRRLSANKQLTVTLAGSVLGLALTGCGMWLLLRAGS
jgi:glucan phosphoethanolaminetransferase (alkaline phosphatase superfamily)